MILNLFKLFYNFQVLDIIRFMSDKRKVKVKLSLSDTDSNQVSLMLRKGAYSVRVIKRAMVLNLFDNGKASPEIAKAVGVTPETARRIAQNYISEG
jgi:hypothetical protein